MMMMTVVAVFDVLALSDSCGEEEKKKVLKRSKQGHGRQGK